MPMGMFDTIRSSYNLGEDFTNVTLQTKDLDCIMSEYWLDPAGNLYEIDFTGTQTFEWNESSDTSFPIVHWKPNGTNGVVRATSVTDYIRVIPEKLGVDYYLTLHFEDGKLQKHFIEH